MVVVAVLLHPVPPTNSSKTFDTDSFTTGGDLGFTIAAPVYDTNSTTSNQPVFLGVVAMDFKVEVQYLFLWSVFLSLGVFLLLVIVFSFNVYFVPIIYCCTRYYLVLPVYIYIYIILRVVLLC